ncbi:conserved Plasmodium protein, unknown function [Plasmodium gallinaceum]|uniref:Dolichyl-diphosphooligosaccharide--protein glycosyltransferase subunit OST2 n=1 Tax=Plasmodium gallinaceum TaxID=5849 RepID=A0A1J1GLS4_PLAGA|nr:conserved Plasmodium protein, unknown function [Plasmodium gallinaceum]CRG93275.1 conserved Plasmodium protein, unknown function [Plasmodium gallinaceum]
MKKILEKFYNNYSSTSRRIKFIDIYIILTFFHLIILSVYAYFSYSFHEKISVTAIFTAIGNITFLVAMREQFTHKSIFNLKREKIIFDFILCSLVLHIGAFSYMHLN